LPDDPLEVVLPNKAAPPFFVVTEGFAKLTLASLLLFLGAGFSFRGRDTGMALAGLGSRWMAKAKEAEPKASPNKIDEVRRNCEDLTMLMSLEAEPSVGRSVAREIPQIRYFTDRVHA
jgi:hypothetical protein